MGMITQLVIPPTKKGHSKAAAKTKMKRYLALSVLLSLSILFLWKLLYLWVYFVIYSPDHLTPGPLRTCNEGACDEGACDKGASNCEGAKNIPRILHHSWKTDQVPEIWSETYKSCLEVHPDYEHMMWTNDDIDKFIREEYAWFYPFFQSYEYDIERVDAARYFILYHYGGVYVDLDVGCRMPMHEMLAETEGYKVIIPAGYPTGLTNWFMATSKHHSLFLHAMHSLQAAYGTYGTPYMSIIWSTGPMFLTRCAAENPEAKTEMMILPFLDLFEKYFTKAPGGSWHKNDAMLFLFLRDLTQNWKHVVCCVLPIISLLIVLIVMCHRQRRIKERFVYLPRRLRSLSWHDDIKHVHII